MSIKPVQFIPVKGDNHPLAIRDLKEEFVSPLSAPKENVTLLSLPTDLLRYIFELIKTNSVMANGKIILTIGQVCKRFLKIAYESPTYKTARQYYELSVERDKLVKQANDLNGYQHLTALSDHTLRWDTTENSHRLLRGAIAKRYGAVAILGAELADVKQAKIAYKRWSSEGPLGITRMQWPDLGRLAIFRINQGMEGLSNLDQINDKLTQAYATAQNKLANLKKQYLEIITFAHSVDLNWKIDFPKYDLSGAPNKIIGGRLNASNLQLSAMDCSVANYPPSGALAIWEKRISDAAKIAKIFIINHV